jgi:hypothetical protein
MASGEEGDDEESDDDERRVSRILLDEGEDVLTPCDFRFGGLFLSPVRSLTVSLVGCHVWRLPDLLTDGNRGHSDRASSPGGLIYSSMVMVST